MLKTMLCAIAACVISSYATTTPAEAVDIQVLEDNGSHITLEFRLKTYRIEDVECDGITCSRIELPGYATFLEKGMPELPIVTKSIIVSDNATVNYRIVDAEYENIPIGPVIPSKGILYRNTDPQSIPYTFDAFYKTDAWWPESVVEIAEPFILRDFCGLTIRFNPFQYNPGRQELRILKRAVVEILDTGEKAEGPITREFLGIYKEFFANFGPTRYDSISERAGRMLIITADAYRDTMNQFISWKKQKGIETKVVTISEIGGNQRDSIKACIQREYDLGGLVWVLLVGDGNEVTPGRGTVGDAANQDADPVYAYTSGSDFYPDLFISRFSSRSGNPINIKKQISRSINYEKQPQPAADWYHIGLGVASNLDGGTGYADSTRMNWLRDSLLQYTYTEVNKSYDSWGSSALIKNYIEAGTGIINYIGHGSTTGWGNGGGFSVTNLNNLNNPWMLPFVISVACLVGNFDGSDCFCEVSVTAGTVDTADGFLVHWGSTINQSWVPPCFGQEGAVNLLTHDKNNTAGGFFFNGACYMIEKYGGGASGVEIAQTWHIFGDASLQLRTDTPQEMIINHAGSIAIGQSTFDVSVPAVENALIGLMIDTVLVGSAYTDSLGNASIIIDPAPDAEGIMQVTVTAYNKTPYFDSVSILGIAENDSPLTMTGSGFSALGPIPFYRDLVIGYQITNPIGGDDIDLSIYDIQGRLVKRFAALPTQPSNQIIWNGKNDRGQSVPAGVYLVRLRIGTLDQTIKAIRLR